MTKKRTQKTYPEPNRRYTPSFGFFGFLCAVVTRRGAAADSVVGHRRSSNSIDNSYVQHL